MKKSWISLVAAVFMLFTLFPGGSFADGSGNASSTFEYVEGQLIVSVAEQPDIASIQQTDDFMTQTGTLGNHGFAIVDSLFGHDSNSMGVMSPGFVEMAVETMGLVYLIEYSRAQYPTIEEAKLSLHDLLDQMGFQVRYISENMLMHAIGTVPDEEATIEMHDLQKWHYEMIRAPEAWDLTTGSAAVRIGVLDTGIDASHPSLSHLVNTSLGASFVGGSTHDVHGHGTHVAGTIASYGVVSGVMQNATLIPVKVLGDNGKGPMYGIQQGIVYAASIQADIINMSLGGGGYSQGMDEAIQTAVNAGSIVVAAAGNDGTESISYPAAYSGSIAVGSVSADRKRSTFSNYGSGLEIMAPGLNIYSTYPNGQYQLMYGTSMSTPHVSGVLGLMKSVNPNLSPAQARTILRNTAQPAGNFYEYGYGIVDAFAAVQAAISGGGGISDDTEPPTAPTDLIATIVTPTSVTLNWNASTDNVGVKGYDIYNESGLLGTVVGTIATISGLTPDTSYTFTVRAKDAAGNESMPSNSVTVTTLPDPNSITCSQVQPWNANTIYLSGDRATYVGKLYEAKWWTQGDQPDHNDEWGAWKYLSDCNGDGGNPGDTEPPTAPTNLRATMVNATRVTLTWDASTDNVGVTGYDVYSGSNLLGTVTGTTITLNGLIPNTSYTFTVRAKDAAGNVSEPSNAETVITTDSEFNPPNPSVDPWSPGVSYHTGDMVTYDGVIYECRIAHTSIVGWEPPHTPALWLSE